MFIIGKIKLYIIQSILILISLFSIAYTACEIEIKEIFFNDEIVAYYLSAIDVNSGVSNIPLFEYSIEASHPDCYPFPEDSTLTLEFSMDIYSPAIGFNSSQELFSGEIEISNITSIITFNNMDINYNTYSIPGAIFKLVPGSYSGPTDENSDNYQVIISSILNSGKIPNGLYTFNFNLINAGQISKTINVNEPDYIHLISPGGSVSDTSNNTIYSTFPVFTWNSDNCSSCETGIRVSEFNPGIHSSPVDAINDIPSLPNIAGNEYYSIDDNINSFQYPTSDSKNLESGKLYAWQLKRLYQSTLGQEEILSPIYVFKIFNTYSQNNNDLDIIKLLIGDEKYNELFLADGLLTGYNELEGSITLNGSEISISELNQIITQIQNGTINIQEISVE